MVITLEEAGKRYRFDWIFKNLSLTFYPNHQYAIQGPNGSGKSTLLKILSGHLTLSKGSILFHHLNQLVPHDRIFEKISFAAPYMELIEEMTLTETILFHSKLKPLYPGLNPSDVSDILALNNTKDKELRFFSSGMKQRVKLALAICSNTPILLLDEPSTNLDSQGIEWFVHLLDNYKKDRNIVIASNDLHDINLCSDKITIGQYK
jgi:ABC-type multidrug transport system ATPase subunit